MKRRSRCRSRESGGRSPSRKALARIDRPFRIHDLRHTFGSRLASEVVEILTISRVMAHKDIATTQRYARLQLRVRARAIGARPAVIRVVGAVARAHRYAVA